MARENKPLTIKSAQCWGTSLRCSPSASYPWPYSPLRLFDSGSSSHSQTASRMSESPGSLITITPTLYILPQAVP